METANTKTEGNKEKVRDKTAKEIDLSDPSYYINRELSWLKFNSRVLEEALDTRHPLLERVKFLSITASNLDEFFMVRVSGLNRQILSGIQEKSIDGMTPGEQMYEIRKILIDFYKKQSKCWQEDLMPKLEEAGIEIRSYASLRNSQKKILRRLFEQEIFPVLTPLAFDPAHPFPHISNLSLNLAVVVENRRKEERFARIKVPYTLPRFMQVPEGDITEEEEKLIAPVKRTLTFVLIEEVVISNLDMLFPGLKIISAYPFCITRDADIDIEADEAGDLLTVIEETLELRYFGRTIRLEVEDTMQERIKEIIVNNLGIDSHQVYTVKGILRMADLMQLTRIERPDIKDRMFVPGTPVLFASQENIFQIIRKNNILLYHPYESFTPVIDFIRQAAKDPDVVAIKQTLYRTGNNRPLFDAFLEARGEGKQVAVLLELKARFDEENNISWARALEDEGVHVVYGVMGMKVHAKLCLVVRREADGLIRYVHMSTGNYNMVTSRIYADIGYFTCDPVIGSDVSDLFNALTGYSAKNNYRSLLVAPEKMRMEIMARIEREIERHKTHKDGYLAFKMNSLVDRRIIASLYRASQAGVKVDLQVRGICCLRPGIKGVSENISVTSVVGRFLEHSRIYYFRNGGEDEVFIGSADMMPRNLDRRIEVLFPVTDKPLKKIVLEEILTLHIRDNMQSRRLLPDGDYVRLTPKKGEEQVDSQVSLINNYGTWLQ
ncbi:MAG: polyphosphate kinase 1 [Deltaproteobacteria bacterium]|nr:polyphosphate kinase 1 [Deltaproteobacteria bacterium]